MFIRKKLNHGQQYAYLVKNTWLSGKGPRQKVGKYLGKVLKLERKSSELFQANEDFSRLDFKDAVMQLVKHELVQHGFFPDKGCLASGGIAVDLTSFSVKNKGRPVVLELNNGFLSEETLRQLQRHDPGKDPEGYELAKLLVGAGINISQEAFIALFEKIKPVAKQEEDAKPAEEFYY